MSWYGKTRGTMTVFSGTSRKKLPRRCGCGSGMCHDCNVGVDRMGG